MESRNDTLLKIPKNLDLYRSLNFHMQVHFIFAELKVFWGGVD